MAILVPVIGVSLLVVLLALALADWLARQLLYPPRQPLTGTPGDYGLDFQSVAFPSADGLALTGWWIPAEPLAGQSQAPVVLLLHPLFGNRQGNVGQLRPRLPLRQPTIDLLQLAARFHQAGDAVLLFDFRGHGESQSGLCAGGLTEDQDVLGAVEYVFGRIAGAPCSVGVVGYGLGAAAALAAVGRFKGGTQSMWVFSADSEGASDWTKVPPLSIKQLRFLVAVQPVSLGTLFQGFMRRVAGPLGSALAPLVSQCCRWHGGYPLEPAALLRFAGGVTMPVLFVQSPSDPRPDCREVQALYDATPGVKQIAWLRVPLSGADSQAGLAHHLDSLLAFAQQAGSST